MKEVYLVGDSWFEDREDAIRNAYRYNVGKYQKAVLIPGEKYNAYDGEET